MKKYYDKNDQVIYNCDNLKLLKSLKDNSINLIYCDILYIASPPQIRAGNIKNKQKQRNKKFMLP